MESRTTRFESENATTQDYTKELIAESGWDFVAGEPVTQGDYATISVTATNKTDGRIHKMLYAVRPNLTEKVVDIYTSYTSIDGVGHRLTAIEDKFSFKAGVKWADIHPWIASTRARHASAVGSTHEATTPAKIGVSFFLPLVWDAFTHGRNQLHERKSSAKDAKDARTLFD